MIDRRKQFELDFLKTRGMGFQDFFAEAMEFAYPHDFVRIRPHGAHGDMKCDGYRTSTSTVFQVYGPDDMRDLRALIRKISDDFEGARVAWDGRMRGWAFVHNQRAGMPAPALQTIQDLREQNPLMSIEVWGFEELWTAVGRASRPGHVDRDVSLPTPSQSSSYWNYLTASRHDIPTPPHLALLDSLVLPMRLRIESKNSSPAEFAKPLIFTELYHVIRRTRFCIIQGEGGSGKTKLLRDFAAREARRLLQSDAARTHRWTPILVDLWRYDHRCDLWSMIFESVNRARADITESQLTAAVSLGYTAILLDGFDEVPAGERRRCLSDVICLSEKYPFCRIVVSSRPHVVSIPGFADVTIEPMLSADVRDAFNQVTDLGLAESKFVETQYRERVQPNVEAMRLSRTPLGLALVIRLALEGRIPKSRYDLYERFFAWLLNWEVQHGRIQSVASAMIELESLAEQIIALSGQPVLQSDWSRRGDTPTRDRLFVGLAQAGILRDDGGAIMFSHKTEAEFFAARHIVVKRLDAATTPSAGDEGVARFLCSALRDVTSLLDRHARASGDIRALMPLIEEAVEAGAEAGMYEQIFEEIQFADDLGIHLTHSSMPHDDQYWSSEIEGLVETCLEFGPLGIVPLVAAADSIVRAASWPDSRVWFEKVVGALDVLRWPGTELYRGLARMGFFERGNAFVSEDDDEGEAIMAYEDLMDFLEAASRNDFDKALIHLQDVAAGLRFHGDYLHDPDQVSLILDV